MANTKKISLYWEEKKITLLEVDKNQPTQSAVIDLQSIFSEAAFNSGLTEEIQTVALIQKTLRESRIEAADVSLALSNKDVILRSFVIPALKSNEVQTAVQFEAKKYIPFDINELRYTFHTIPIVVDKVKRLRVVLYAVRKEIIEKYERIIKQTGLNLVSCEPAVVGLCRAMLFHKEIQQDSRIAVLDINEQTGSIYFIEKGMAVFIRDFQVSIAAVNTGEAGEHVEEVKSRIYNEIRNSFDFFNRQHSEEINQLLVCGEQRLFDMISSFSSDLNVKLRDYQATLTSLKSFHGIDLMSSFGVLIPPPAGGAPVSDLYNIKQRSKESSLQKGISVQIDMSEFVPVLKVLIPVVLCCGGLYAYFYFQNYELAKQAYILSTQQGEFGGFSTEDLRGKINQLGTDQNEIKKIRLKTNLHVISALVTQHVSEGMWLDSFDVKFVSEDSDEVVLDFKGNIYLSDVSLQVKTVNDFIARLRLDKDLSSFFKKIQLLTIQRQDNGGVTSTTFSVHCF